MTNQGHKEKLYRKVNTRTRGVHHGSGGEFRFERNTKAEKASDRPRGSMHGNKRHGLDYTPLCKFLLSRIGRNWDEIFSEAVSRLDRPDPIFWMVARSEAEKKPIVRLGESTYYSGLYIDENNKLALVDPALSIDELRPSCACCTHTFNGERFTKRYGEQ